MILCDTNILIELYKANPQITQELRAIGQQKIAISAITQAELYFGALNKQELTRIKTQLSLIQIFSLDKEISKIFIRLMEKYALSHQLAIPDALIAATSLVKNIPLYTLNIKDFRYIEGLKLRTQQ